MAYPMTFCISHVFGMNSLGHPGRVAIVAHDAGGAEILASLVEKNKILDARFVLAGPAERIFNQRLGEVPRASLSEALQVCDWVLTGTGWQTDFEWHAIHEGRVASKHRTLYVEHLPSLRREATHCPDGASRYSKSGKRQR